jgi:hypothetical protein
MKVPPWSRVGSVLSTLAFAGAMLVAGAPSALATTARMVVTGLGASPSPDTYKYGSCGYSYIQGQTDGFVLDSTEGVGSSLGPILFGAYTIHWDDGATTGGAIPPNGGTWSRSASHQYASVAEFYDVYLSGYVETVPAQCTILDPDIYIQVPGSQFYP